MDTNPDDLKRLERRLSTWQPSESGLTPDAMLFAAGRASARGGKAWLAWPILSGCLTLAVVVLAVGLASERAQRQTLANSLKPKPVEALPSGGRILAPEPLAPDSYLTLRRQWEQQRGDVATALLPDQASNLSGVAEPRIFRAWRPDGPPDSL